MSVATPGEILDFWFKEIPHARWFQADPEFDTTIKSRFEESWHAAREGRLDTWAGTKDGALALIVLLDQFPRNMFRGKAEAFATDELALRVAEDALKRGLDRDATLDERNFLYLPLMHSENLRDQEHCVRLTAERLGKDHYSYPFALRHRDAVARFGRFPARNAALGRASTEEEKAFLAESPSGF
jgi:uncharacterized protein (DUF924 family)